MSTSPNDPPENLSVLKPGLRAARERQGLTQEQAAALVNAPLSSYRRWDRGANPRDPEMAQALAEALATPIAVIWPPEENAHVDLALRTLRERRARAAAEARLAQPPPNDPDLWDTTHPAATPHAAPEPGPASSAPGPETSARIRASTVPDPRDIVRTLDGLDRPKAVRGSRHRRPAIAAVVAVIAVLAGGTALATTGSDRAPSTVRAAVVTGPTPVQRERAVQAAALARARDRGDFDAAIAIATRLGDTKTTAQLHHAAGEVLARRARAAADRGDLDLATSRLTRARQRYGNAPSLSRLQRRITTVKNARKARAARRRVAARKRAARTAATATAAGQRTTTPATPTPAPAPAATPTPTPTPAATPTPSPTRSAPPAPAPRPSGGSSSGGRSTGGSAEAEFGYLGG